MKRHPEIVTRTPESVSGASACVLEKDIRGRFDHVQKFLDENNLSYLLQKPRQIFNWDETNYILSPEGKAVHACKGAKNVHEVEAGQSKQTLTCMFTFSAAGETVPPLMVYPYKRVPHEIVNNVPKD